MRTWYDMVELLTQTIEASATDGRAVYLARLAVQQGIKDLGAQRDWSDRKAWFNFASNADYSTGTIAYDHTGGAYERLVTLTDGTWPSWAASGTVLISNVPYLVERRLSDTTLTLRPTSNPGADVASGTSFYIYQEYYPLPADCSGNCYLQRLNDFDPQPVTPAEFHTLKESQEYIGQPRSFTVLPHPSNAKQNAVWFYPAPTSAEAFMALYRRRSLTLDVVDYSTGTVSVSGGGTVVTGSGTAFSAEMVGGVFRFGTTASVPESRESTSNAFVEEAEILAVDSATSLTLATPVVNAFSSVKFRISSRIPFEDGALEYAAQEACRWRFGALSNASQEERRRLWQDYQSALSRAKAEDGSRTYGSSPTGTSRQAAIAAAILNPQFDYS